MNLSDFPARFRLCWLALAFFGLAVLPAAAQSPQAIDAETTAPGGKLGLAVGAAIESTENPADDTENPADDTENPADDTENPADAAEPGATADSSPDSAPANASPEPGATSLPADGLIRENWRGPVQFGAEGWQSFELEVATDAAGLEISLSGEGQADLFVRHGEPMQDWSQADFRSLGDGAGGRILLDARDREGGLGGRWFVDVVSPDPANTRAQLEVRQLDAITLADEQLGLPRKNAAFGVEGDPQQVVGDSTSVALGFDANRTEALIALRVDASVESIDLQLVGDHAPEGTDLDLFVGYNRIPAHAVDAHACSTGYAATESVTLARAGTPGLRPGLWYVKISQFGGGDVELPLEVTFHRSPSPSTPASVPGTQPGVTAELLQPGPFAAHFQPGVSAQQFAIDVPPGTESLRVTSQAGTTDIDLELFADGPVDLATNHGEDSNATDSPTTASESTTPEAAGSSPAHPADSPAPSADPESTETPENQAVAADLSPDGQELVFLDADSDEPLRPGRYFLVVTNADAESALPQVPLELSFNQPPQPAEAVAPGELTHHILPAGSSSLAFSVEVPEGTRTLRFAALNATRDVDLFARHGRYVQRLSGNGFDREQVSDRAPEWLTVGGDGDQPLAAGTWYFEVANLMAEDRHTEFDVVATLDADLPFPPLPTLPWPAPQPLTPLETALQSVVRLDTPEASGSGTLVSAAGHILTNWHVAFNQQQGRLIDDDFLVSLTNPAALDEPPAQLFRARLLAADRQTDIALLQITTDIYDRPVPAGYAYPVARLGDPELLRHGNALFVAGYPATGGQESRTSITTTSGIVSGFNTGANGQRITLKTDAKINAGNSGGAIFNAAGDLVAVPHSEIIIADDELGFAAPVRILPDAWLQILRETGTEIPW